MCRVSFLIILDIYKAYFKGHYTDKNTYRKWPRALFSLQEITASFAPYGFVTKYFLIFIVDEVKNFVANNIFKLLKLVMYWDPYKMVAFIYWTV